MFIEFLSLKDSNGTKSKMRDAFKIELTLFDICIDLIKIWNGGRYIKVNEKNIPLKFHVNHFRLIRDITLI